MSEVRSKTLDREVDVLKSLCEDQTIAQLRRRSDK
jgi:hypothetical protein